MTVNKWIYCGLMVLVCFIIFYLPLKKLSSCSIHDIDCYLKVEGHAHFLMDGDMYTVRKVAGSLIWQRESDGFYFVLIPVGVGPYVDPHEEEEPEEEVPDMEEEDEEENVGV